MKLPELPGNLAKPKLSGLVLQAVFSLAQPGRPGPTFKRVEEERGGRGPSYRLICVLAPWQGAITVFIFYGRKLHSRLSTLFKVKQSTMGSAGISTEARLTPELKGFTTVLWDLALPVQPVDPGGGGTWEPGGDVGVQVPSPQAERESAF